MHSQGDRVTFNRIRRQSILGCVSPEAYEKPPSKPLAGRLGICPRNRGKSTPLRSSIVPELISARGRGYARQGELPREANDGGEVGSPQSTDEAG